MDKCSIWVQRILSTRRVVPKVKASVYGGTLLKNKLLKANIKKGLCDSSYKHFLQSMSTLN